jgi:hypothetical protein
MTPMTRAQAIQAVTGPGGPFEIVAGGSPERPTRLFRHAPASLRAIFEATVFGQLSFDYL